MNSPNETPLPTYGDIVGTSKWCKARLKKVLVCGSRDFNKDSEKVYTEAQVFAKLDELRAGYLKDYFLVVVNGWGDGVDLAAAKWAEARCIPFFNVPAHWTVYRKLAGPYRNQLMLDIAEPDIVIAFPGNRGTKDMKERAAKAQIELIEIEF